MQHHAPILYSPVVCCLFSLVFIWPQSCWRNLLTLKKTAENRGVFKFKNLVFVRSHKNIFHRLHRSPISVVSWLLCRLHKHIFIWRASLLQQKFLPSRQRLVVSWLFYRLCKDKLICQASFLQQRFLPSRIWTKPHAQLPSFIIQSFWSVIIFWYFWLFFLP